MKPEIIEGGIFTDHRGHIAYVNNFDLSQVKRFYTIQHPDTSTVRAWQGHQIERKWFYVIQGRFVMAWVKIDSWNNPSPNLVAEHVILSAEHSRVLCIPAGYANGLKALDRDAKIIVFSDMDVEQSKQEKIRYNAELWLNWENFA